MARRTFGEMVRDLRLNHGCSQRELAKEIGISPSYIQGIEAGIRRPKGQIIEPLCEFLGCGPKVKRKLDERLEVERQQAKAGVKAKRKERLRSRRDLKAIGSRTGREGLQNRVRAELLGDALLNLRGVLHSSLGALETVLFSLPVKSGASISGVSGHAPEACRRVASLLERFPYRILAADPKCLVAVINCDMESHDVLRMGGDLLQTGRWRSNYQIVTLDQGEAGHDRELKVLREIEIEHPSEDDRLEVVIRRADCVFYVSDERGFVSLTVANTVENELPMVIAREGMKDLMRNDRFDIDTETIALAGSRLTAHCRDGLGGEWRVMGWETDGTGSGSSVRYLW